MRPTFWRSCSRRSSRPPKGMPSNSKRPSFHRRRNRPASAGAGRRQQAADRGKRRRTIMTSIRAVCCLRPAVCSERGTNVTQIQTGLQLYTLRNLMKDDFYGTLRKVAEAGYKAVEFAGYGGNAATDLKAKMDEFGLETMGAHVPYQRFDDEFDAVVSELLTLEAE